MEEKEDKDLQELQELEQLLKRKLSQGDMKGGDRGSRNTIKKLDQGGPVNSLQANMQNSTGLKFDMTGFLQDNRMTSVDEVNNILNIADKKTKRTKKSIKRKKSRKYSRKWSSSSSSESSSGDD